MVFSKSILKSTVHISRNAHRNVNVGVRRAQTTINKRHETIAVNMKRDGVMTHRNLNLGTRRTQSTMSKNEVIATTNANNMDSSGMRPMLKYSLMATGGAITVGAVIVKLMHDEVGGTDGLKRTASFYSLAIPAYIEYRTHMMLNSSEETWDELDRRTSAQGLEKILELGGFYIKSGQMCASNIGNAFPRIWQETMSILQDQCPSQPFPVIKEIIEADYGKPMSEIFATFEETPIGAASIGQVHRATLHTGESVVVKVSYPQVEQVFRGDVRTIKMFSKVAQPVHVPPLEEIERQFMTEFDYKQEAYQMEKVRENLERVGLAGRGKLCKVPKAFLNLSTKRVLVMEELKGEKLPEALQKDFEIYAKNAGMSVDEFKAKEDAKVRELKEKGKDTNGPSAKEYDMYIKMVGAKRRAENLSAMVHNYTLGLIPCIPKKAYREKTLPINHARLIDDLILIHGHECLVDGYFNGDPHPGNVLMLGSNTGNAQIGLIDYGQVKQLTKSERLHLCKIIIALAKNDKQSIVSLMKEAGFKSKAMDEEVIYKYAKVSYDEDNDSLTEGKHIQMFMEDLQARDPISNLPDCYIMVGRTSVILRGFAHALRQSRSIAKAWAPIAEKALQAENEKFR